MCIIHTVYNLAVVLCRKVSKPMCSTTKVTHKQSTVLSRSDFSKLHRSFAETRYKHNNTISRQATLFVFLTTGIGLTATNNFRLYRQWKVGLVKSIIYLRRRLMMQTKFLTIFYWNINVTPLFTCHRIFYIIYISSL